MIIKIIPTRGIAPRISPYELDDKAAQTADNCLFGSGSLRPLVVGQAEALNANDAIVASPKSWFKYTGSRWLNWTADVDTNRSMVALDAEDRLYWTDPALTADTTVDGSGRAIGGMPRMGGRTQIIGSAGTKPSASYRLGIPKPMSAPTASAATATTTEKLFRSYIYTYVSSFGEEGPPSDPSNEIEVDPSVMVTLTGMSVAPTGAHSIATKRIYRVNTGSTASEYQFVVEVAVSAQLPDPGDTILDANLGEVCLSYTWAPPPSQMIGLKAHPSGFFIGYYNRDSSGVLCFSVPYLPHAWSRQIVVDSPIVAVGLFGTSAIVVTDSYPIALTGSDPDNMTIERLETGEACTCKRAFVDMGCACIYPGVSGLWAAGTGTVKSLTESIISKKEWDALFVSNALVFAAQYNTLYIGFQATGGFVFDTVTSEFYAHSITADSAFTDNKTGDLYYHTPSAANLKKWGVGTAQSFVWKSKKFRLDHAMSFSVGQVFATGTITAKIYADGALKHTQTVSSSDPFRLPSGFVAKEWEMQLEGTSEIMSAYIATSMSELARV
jgi:hypothetical protein